MIPFEEYKERYVTFYGIFNDELLKLAYLIDCRLEEAKGTVGSANLGVGYWIAEKLIQEGYCNTNGLAAVLKESTDEAIKRMNEDLGRRFIPIQEYLRQHDSEVRKETANDVISWFAFYIKSIPTDKIIDYAKEEFGVEVEE